MVVLIGKMESFVPANANLVSVAKGLELRLITDNELPPCHFYIGIAAILRRNYQDILKLSESIQQDVKTMKPVELVQKVNAKLDESPQIDALLRQVSQFMLLHTNYTDSLFSLLNGFNEQQDIVKQFIEFSQIGQWMFLQFQNMELSMNTEHFSGSVHSQADAKPLQFPLVDYMYNGIAALSSEQKLVVIAPLLIYYVSQNAQLTRESTQLVFNLLLVNENLAEFVYLYLNEQLFSSVLVDEQLFSDAVVDLLVLLLVQMSNLELLQ